MPGRVSPRLLAMLERLMPRIQPSAILIEKDGEAYLYDRKGNTILEKETNHGLALEEAIKLGGTILLNGTFTVEPGEGASIPDGAYFTLYGMGAKIINKDNTNGLFNDIGASGGVKTSISLYNIDIELAQNGARTFYFYYILSDIKLRQITLKALPNTNIDDTFVVVNVENLRIADCIFDLIGAQFDGLGAFVSYTSSRILEFTGNTIISDYVIPYTVIIPAYISLQGSIARPEVVRVTNNIYIDLSPGNFVAINIQTAKRAIVQGNIGIGIRSLARPYDVDIAEIRNNMLYDIHRGLLSVESNPMANEYIIEGNTIVCASNAQSCEVGVRHSTQATTAKLIYRGNTIRSLGPTISFTLQNVILETLENNRDALIVDNGGTTTLSGDGTTTDFIVGQHGLTLTGLTDPSKVSVHCTPASIDAITASPVTCYLSDEDGDGVYESVRAKFTTAPVAGTNNVTIVWRAKRVIW